MAQEFKLHRTIKANTATLGILLDLEGNPICKTLENPWLNNHQGISCIPEGTYRVQRDSTGNFQYWKLLNVPNRSNIEIHNGNKEKHTKGCILFGKDWCIMDDELAVSSSRSTLDYLVDKKILPNEFDLNITS